eukprot:SAG25_NODE_7891_length_451_cov_1.306818_1_plen_113_part_10
MAWQVKRSRASDAHVRALLADVDAADSALSAAAAAVKGVLPPREVAVAPAASAGDGAEVTGAGAAMEERRQLSPHTMVDGESGDGDATAGGGDAAEGPLELSAWTDECAIMYY